MKWLGLDLGSISLNLILLDAAGQIVAEQYIRHHGQPLPAALRELTRLNSDPADFRLGGIGLTGAAGKVLAGLLGVPHLNEIVSLSRGCRHLAPSTLTLIDIGGEDAKAIFFSSENPDGSPTIEDFSMNTICAAGTGSFLDQQAARLGLKVEELGELALMSPHPPRIAGRCSVFAKTDMIHLQQEGTPDREIVAGLCLAMARNFKSTVLKGKDLIPPVIFLGGVAANRGMVRSLREVLQCSPEEFIVPRHFTSFGAVGAALTAREVAGDGFILDLSRLAEHLSSPPVDRDSLSPLSGRVGGYPTGPKVLNRLSPPAAARPPLSCYLGIDIGSISTKAAAIDPDGKLLAAVYLKTTGQPLAAVREVMQGLARQLPEEIEVRGVGTTGSGRYLIGDFVGADEVKNEISAQARAAAHLDKEVETIFEIGGQDSKYISLMNGSVVDFEMNKVCAAGTGSFLEEQAEKLKIKIEEEFGEMALRAGAPVSLGERCTVFMESGVIHHQQQGANREDLVAGLAYSIARNYLNRVVGTKKIGRKIFFQGAVAFNTGVVAAFEKLLENPVTVPPHPHLTGAIGAALWAQTGRKAGRWNRSRFKGFREISDCSYRQTSFECEGCPNHCTINQVTLPDGPPLFYGSRCEKYEVKQDDPKGQELPDLFEERERILHRSIPPPTREPAGPIIGLPRALLFHEQLPLWQTFFQNLGYRVVLSSITNKEIIRQGLEGAVSETCFPVKVAYGHLIDLLAKGVEILFFPTLINLEQETAGWPESFNCPYVQSFPYLANAALDLDRKGIRLLNPTLAFGWKKNFPLRSLLQVGRQLGRSRRDIRSAARAALRAQAVFRELLRQRGREILNSLPPDRKAVVVVSRPYNGYDPGLNLNLPRKLRKLGILAIPMEFLPLHQMDLSSSWPNMYWRYGQRILQAARLIRQDPRLYALYLTNFGCGPDSFIHHFFAREMEGKPFLQIEVDEHSADVGVITRCEAFWDSIHHALIGPPPPEEAFTRKRGGFASTRIIYLPYLGDVSFVVASAFRAEGKEARVFPPSTPETLTWGRKFTSGKECYPCIITIGDMVRITREPDFQPDRSAFFMPSTSGPCRFGQYCHLQRMVLDQLGYPQVPILAPVQDESFYRDLAAFGPKFFRRSWRGMVACDLLGRIRRERRPAEVEPGSTEAAYQSALKEICRAAERKEDIFKAFRNGLTYFDEQKLKSEDRPLIGIVGEIFVRNHPFSNDFLIEQIESLGGEVWLPPVREWLLHLNRVLKLQCRELGRWSLLIKAWLIGRVQERDERRMVRLALPYLRHGPGAGINQIWNNAEPYLPSWFGEAALSAGQSIAYFRRGVGGIINVMPFTCLPGTIFTTVLHRLRKDCDNIPALTIAFDGLQQSTTSTRLEAFMHQARERHRTRRDSSVQAEDR